MPVIKYLIAFNGLHSPCLTRMLLAFGVLCHRTLFSLKNAFINCEEFLTREISIEFLYLACSLELILSSFVKKGL